MKNADETYIPVGKFGTAYGIRGWLKIHSYTEFGANILEYTPWYIEDTQTTWKMVKVEDAREHGKGIIVKLPDIDTPEAARLLTGKLIAIHRSQLPVLKEDEYYWSDLIGLTVINKDGSTMGKVIYIMETGSNDVLVVKGEHEQAIPFLLDSVIKKVDLEKKEIHVDWELL